MVAARYPASDASPAPTVLRGTIDEIVADTQRAAELGDRRWRELLDRHDRITRDEVYVADEAFFTGTAAEVTPIREVDNRPVGNGSRGPITEKLQKAYFDLVTGKTDAHAEWRTLVK